MARDNRIDTLKGLLMILVILGHIIVSLDNNSPLNHAVMGGIYVFHMPLFILISGYLTKSPARQSAREMWRGVGNVFIVMVIFHLLSWLMVYLLQSNVMDAIIHFPYGVLWYLLSLMCWRVMLYYTPRKLLDRPALYLGIALVVSALCGLTKLGTTFSLQRTLNFYFFFLLGYYYRQGMLPARWWHNNVLHGAVAAVSLPLLLWLYPHCGNMLNGADHYTWGDMPQKLLILASSTSVSLLVFNLMPSVAGLRHIGRDSLFYYVYHYYIFDLSLAPVIRGYQWSLTLPYLLLYCGITVIVLLALSKNHVFMRLVQPMLKKPAGPHAMNNEEAHDINHEPR